MTGGEARMRQERRKLMERYGFPNEAAFFNYLELYASPEGCEHA
jgi:hypothetical protein